MLHVHEHPSSTDVRLKVSFSEKVWRPHLMSLSLQSQATVCNCMEVWLCVSNTLTQHHTCLQAGQRPTKRTGLLWVCKHSKIRSNWSRSSEFFWWRGDVQELPRFNVPRSCWCGEIQSLSRVWFICRKTPVDHNTRSWKRESFQILFLTWPFLKSVCFSRCQAILKKQKKRAVRLLRSNPAS